MQQSTDKITKHKQNKINSKQLVYIYGSDLF